MSDDPDRVVDRPCEQCNGTGYLRQWEGDLLVSEADCPSCDGNGRIDL